MNESQQELQQLQQLLTNSIERAGQFLQQSFQMPEHSLSAKQLVKHLQRPITISLATITKNAAPRVAPIGAIFYRGQFYIPTVMEAARSKMLKNNPNISLTYYESNDFALILHGKADFVRQESDIFLEVEKLHLQYNKISVTQWGGEGVFIRVQTDVIYTFARFIDKF
jgi:uncharacterized pyridoxamine 5'-phosphate oxidase family protein